VLFPAADEEPGPSETADETAKAREARVARSAAKGRQRKPRGRQDRPKDLPIAAE
jgi:hypothetical protein